MRTRAALTSLAAVAALAAGCQGRGRDRDGARVEPPAADADGSGAGGAGSPGSGAAPDASGGGSGAGSGAGSAAATVEDPDAPADPSKQIAELGAISAWQAVIDRAQLLGRRGQKGVVFGRVGPAILVPAPAPAPAPGDAGTPPPPPPDAGLIPSPYAWLVDDTEGNGSLGIRIALGKHTATAKEGDRIAASGAWELDEERRWFWRANALQPLAAPSAPAGAGSGSAAGKPAADAPPAVPGHVPPAGPFPPGVKPIKQAKDGDLVYFQLVGPYPARPGDGWLVASELGDIPVALLVLPGERGSYGGMDMRTPDEHWQLRRQQIYWVRLGRIRSQGAGKPFVVTARTGPVRVQ